MRSPMSRFLPLLAALVALPLAGCSAFSPDSSEPGDAAPRPKPTVTSTPVPGGVAADFFGMHDSDPVGKSWPKVPVGSLRVWDAGVVWRQVETAPGVYDFGRLDAIVKSARDHKAQTLIVLGQTPTFHARKPKKVGSYGPGAASMPDLAAWTAYVQAVVQRYAGDDVAFQVWNEANVEGYWNGTPRQMAKLTAAARTVVDAVTPKPVLVAPAMAVRNIGQRAGLRDLYAKKVAGVPVADLVDVVSLQLYPEVDAGPERSLELLDAARGILARAGVAADKPIWDTEVNYGLQGGEVATPASTEQQQANVALTYLINAAGGIGRVYWYAWDLHAIADTDLVGHSVCGGIGIRDGAALAAGLQGRVLPADRGVLAVRASDADRHGPGVLGAGRWAGIRDHGLRCDVGRDTGATGRRHPLGRDHARGRRPASAGVQ
jgi:polysaccharide biosynthesis protein PslG